MILKRAAKNAMVAAIQTKWKHNPGSAYIVAQKRLGRRDRSKPSYERFSELMSRISGGAWCPQLTRLMPRPACRSGVDRIFWLNVDAYYSSR